MQEALSNAAYNDNTKRKDHANLYEVELVAGLGLSWVQATAKGVPPALAELRQTVATQLQPPDGFQEEVASQAEQGGLITPGDWSQGSDKWAHAWSAICQVCRP